MLSGCLIIFRTKAIQATHSCHLVLDNDFKQVKLNQTNQQFTKQGPKYIIQNYWILIIFELETWINFFYSFHYPISYWTLRSLLLFFFSEVYSTLLPCHWKSKIWSKMWHANNTLVRSIPSVLSMWLINPCLSIKVVYAM